MPRPRFRRLSKEKRERIFEAAAKEFAAHGYHDASMNKILEAADISKGAAYYYFDDKADLFATTVRHYADKVVGDLPPALSDVDAETFWPTLAEFYCRQFAYFHDKPWAFGVVKAAARLSVEERAAIEPLQAYLGELEHSITDLLEKGQELGVIRTDLPNELLVGLFIAVDDAADRWLLARWHSLEQEEVEDIVRRIILGLERLLAPVTEDDS